MKTYLVTGGAGFIGSNFVYYMLEKYPECRIVCLDNLTYAGNLQTLKAALENPNFRFVKGDITDRETVFSLFNEEAFDIVVNFAAESHVDRSIEDPGIFLRTNILGTQILMDDLLALSYYRTFKLPVTISRCSNNYGPYHFPQKIIPLIIDEGIKLTVKWYLNNKAWWEDIINGEYVKYYDKMYEKLKEIKN